MDSTSSPRTGLNKFYHYMVSAAFTAAVSYVALCEVGSLTKHHHERD